MIIFSFWLRTHNMRVWELEKKHKFLITIVDTWGSDLTTAAILHLASTVPKKLLFRACNFISYNKVSTAKFLDNENNTSMDPRTRKNPPNGPGLGKVMIEKSCSEVSLIGQDTIENVSYSIKNLKSFFFLKFHIFLMHQNVPKIIETFLRYMMVS